VYLDTTNSFFTHVDLKIQKVSGRRDQRMAAVLILRILSAMLGLWLLFFSIAQLLHHHGHL
jgi:hypothetical protein